MAEQRGNAASPVRAPDTPPALAIGVGIAAVLIGSLVAGLGSGLVAALGTVLLAIGAIVAGIGVVAAGVRLGIQWADYDRSRSAG